MKLADSYLRRMQLKDLYPLLSTAEREALAKKAGIGAAYLYQLATRFKDKKPSLEAMQKLAEADRRLKLNDLMREFSAPKTPEAKAEG